MNKILLSLAVASMATLSLQADTFFDKTQSIGVGTTMSTTEMGDVTSDPEYGLNVNGVFLKQMHFKEDCHLSLGVTINADINKPVDDLNTLVDVLPTVSLAVPNMPINIQALAGYTYGVSGDTTSMGITYGAGVGYDVTPEVSINAKYLRSNLTGSMDGLSDYDYDTNRVSLGVNYSF